MRDAVRKICQCLAEEDPNQQYLSFEFIPPRSEKAEETLLNHETPLCVHQKPVFIDMTWGAGGTSSESTMRITKHLQDAYPSIPINMHLTCTNMAAGLIKEALDFCKANGICNIVALRGDPPKGHEFCANPDGLNCALDLVRYIRAEYGDFFCISVAGYPEGHCDKLPADGTISADDFACEMAYLKEKVDAGADIIITQLFYDADLFIKFVRRCRQEGITIPILPGLLPVTRYASLMRMVNLCKTYMPAEMKEKVEALKDDPEALKDYGVAQCTAMIQAIQAADIGCNHFHFYTINNAEQSFRVMQAVGLYTEPCASHDATSNENSDAVSS